MTDDTKLIQPIKYIHTHSSSYSAHDVIKIARPQEVCFATGSLKNHDSGNIDSMNDKMKLSVKKDFLSGYECENFLCDIIEEEDSLFLEIEPLHICISANNLNDLFGFKSTTRQKSRASPIRKSVGFLRPLRNPTPPNIRSTTPRTCHNQLQ